MTRISRRTALAWLVAGGAAPAALLPGTQAFAQSAKSMGVSEASLDRAIGILAGNPSIDLHNHLGYWETRGIDPIMTASVYRGDESTRAIMDSMVAGKAKCAWVNLTGDVPIINLGQPGNKGGDYEGDQAWKEYQRQMAILNEFRDTMPMQMVGSVEEIQTAHESGKLAVLLSTEGGHMVEDDIERIDQLHADGLTKFQPIHYVHTKLGDNQTDPSTFGGMSSLGKDAVRRAAKLGMVIDVAHASYDGAKHMADITGVPIMLSHTMMKWGLYLDNRPRFITRDYAFLVAQTGGVIGTWTVGEPVGVKDRPTFYEGVHRLADTVGIDHVGWSTDYITFAMPEWFNDYVQFPGLCAGLLDTGFSDEDLVKFIGGNAKRVFDAARAA